MAVCQVVAADKWARRLGTRVVVGEEVILKMEVVIDVTLKEDDRQGQTPLREGRQGSSQAGRERLPRGSE